jgi:hypothetical protein
VIGRAALVGDDGFTAIELALLEGTCSITTTGTTGDSIAGCSGN